MPTNVLVLNKSWLVTGAGDPEGMQEAPVGSLFLREDGEEGATLYIKESGIGVNGWVPLGGVVTAHAASHSFNGSDQVSVQPAQVKIGTPSRLLGRGATMLMAISEEITLGPTLKMTGAVLDAVPPTTVPLHAATHAPGGSDPITIPPAVPSAHAASHQPGGADPLTALSGAVITSGTVADARLSANVALKATRNLFTTSQEIRVAGNPFPRLFLTDTAQPANEQKFNVVAAVGSLWLQSLSDDEASAPGYVRMSRTGDFVVSGAIWERGRALPMGDWQETPFNPADYYASAGGTWTIGAPAVIRNRYTVIGHTMHWSLYIAWYNGSNVITIGSVPAVCIRLPGGYQCQPSNQYSVAYAVDGGRVAIDAQSAGPDVRFSRQDSQNWTGNQVGIITTLTLELT